MALIFGHRGARGEYPENCIEGFIYAASLGIYGIEMDVVISADKKVVVSHESTMNPKICNPPELAGISKLNKIKPLKKANIYRMNYATVKQYDCGKIGNPDFPHQRKLPSHKPLLGEVIREVENYTKKNRIKPIVYNIEIKSEPAGDNTEHPRPVQFAELLMNELLPFRMSNRIILQSFDMRPLKVIHAKYPQYRIGMLVYTSKVIKARLKKLGFTPETCGVYYKNLSRKWVEHIRALDMKALAWTVNNPADVKRILKTGLEGIITDYPARVKKIIEECL